MARLVRLVLLTLAAALGPAASHAQQPALGVIPGMAPPAANPVDSAAKTGTQTGIQPGVQPGYVLISPIVQPTLSPGVIALLELEGRFSQETTERGGKAFASWFADDAVTLSNGKPAVLGRGAIAQTANWDPKAYQLSWVAQGAQMGPSNDMGFTWGRYEGHATDHNGKPIVTSGRYITIWKKLPNGSWKVAMDASADEPPSSGDCCALPKP